MYKHRSCMCMCMHITPQSQWHSPSFSFYTYFHTHTCTYVHTNIHRGLTQQCCYSDDGALIPGIGQPNIGSPLYEDMAMLVTHMRDTVLLKIYCCIQGLPKLNCERLESKLITNNGEGYEPPIPGNIVLRISTFLILSH